MTDLPDRCNAKRIKEGKEEYDEPDSLQVCIDFEDHPGDHIWRSASAVGPLNPWELGEGDLARPERRWQTDAEALRSFQNIVKDGFGEEMSKKQLRYHARTLAMDASAYIGRAQSREMALHPGEEKFFDCRTPACAEGKHEECDIFNCECECHDDAH